MRPSYLIAYGTTREVLVKVQTHTITALHVPLCVFKDIGGLSLDAGLYLYRDTAAPLVIMILC